MLSHNNPIDFIVTSEPADSLKHTTAKVGPVNFTLSIEICWNSKS